MSNMTCLTRLCPRDEVEGLPEDIAGNALRKAAALCARFPAPLADCPPLAPIDTPAFEDAAAARKAIRGFIGKAPLTCALATAMAGPSEPGERDAYDRLLACWLATLLAQRDQITAEHADALRAAGLSLRRLMTVGLHPELRRLLDANDAPPDSLALARVLASLVAQINAPDAAAARVETATHVESLEVLVGLERAIAFLMAARAPRPRVGGKHAPDEAPIADEGCRESSAEPMPDSSHVDAAPPIAPALESTAVRLPAEAGYATGTTQSNPGIDARGATRPGKTAIRSLSLPRLGGPDNMARRAQCARAQPLQLSRSALLTAYDGALLAARLPDAAQPVRLTLAAALYGGPLFEKITQCPVLDKAPDWDAFEMGFCWLRSGKPGFLVRNHVNAHLPGPMGDAPCAPVAPDLLLCIDTRLPGGEELIEWAADQEPGAPLIEPAMVDAARRWLDELRADLGGALRLTRVIQQLPRHLTNLTGDRLLGQLIAPPPLASDLRARMAYRQYPVDAITQWHARGCRSLAAWMEGTLEEDMPVAPPWPGHVVGSQRAAPAEAFVAWANELQARIPILGRGRLSWSTLRDFHNAYVLYVLTAHLCNGGVRISRPGFATASLVGGRRLLDDKARAKREESTTQTVQNVRAVPVTPTDLRQHQWWMRHLQVLRRRVKQPLPAWPWLGERAGGVLALTPKLWRAQARSPMAPNAARHYLATALVAQALPADRVNQWLGHATAAEATGNPWSTAEPLPTPEEQAIWNQVVSAMGFGAREGLGRG